MGEVPAVTATAESITIPLALYERMTFEIHYLRGKLGGEWVRSENRAREAKQARQEYVTAMQRALTDPAYRRCGISPPKDWLSG